MPVVMVHKYPHLIDECCHLLNTEWPRSQTARQRTLEMSCDTLPTSLVLIQDKKVIGHSKLSVLPSATSGCFVESVIIHPHYRGQGFGKELMTATEEFAKSQGMETVYLSTTNQQGFYQKLGYTVCGPVSIYGCPCPLPQKEFCASNAVKKVTIEPLPSLLPAPPPPPPPSPPPPPPPPLPQSQNQLKKGTIKTYMKKSLSL